MRGRTSFAGQIAVITGGASGIGRALGAELLAQGAHVVLADIDSRGVARVATELAGPMAGGGSITGAALDVRDGRAVRELVDAIACEHGRIDLLFNNAGLSLGGPTHELTRAHWERIVDVNLLGVVNGVLAAYPRMIEQGHGHIVNTASVAGLAPAVYLTAYTATKHALVGLSTSLRPEAAAYGVRVSALCPGAVDTAILDRPVPADLPPTLTPPVPARRYLATIGQKPIPADRFARAAVRGVARNRALIIVPARGRAPWYLQRVSPGAMQRVNAFMGRRVARDLLGDPRPDGRLRSPPPGY